MSDGNEVELQGVVHRFKDAAATLDELRQRLRAVSEIEESRNTALSSIERAATAIEDSTAALSTTSATVAGAALNLEEALIASAKMIEQGSEATVTKSLEQLAEGLTSLGKQFETQSKRVADVYKTTAAKHEQRFTDLENMIRQLSSEVSKASGDNKKLNSELTALRAKHARLESEHAALQLKLKGLSDRQRSKLGM